MRSVAGTRYFGALNILALLNAHVATAQDIVSSTYVLDTVYQGSTFFDGFDFQTTPDLTHGFVNYVGRDEAQTLGLINTASANGAYMGVDFTSNLTSSSVGRNSVRITSKKSFTHGLIISDIAHMPGGICGTWPAHWTLGPDWPENGEIDIIEGVNSQSENLMSLHTNGTCTIAGDTRYQTGTAQTLNCNVDETANSGCGITSDDPASYGPDFNDIQGGVYATQWTSDYIRIWFFRRGAVPADITAGEPDPSLWGLPDSNFQGNCDIDEHFADHSIIFDTTFCGDWGANVWKTDAVCSSLAPTCVDYVASYPGAFQNAYWAVNSIKVYQLGDSTTLPVSGNASIALTSTQSEEHFTNTNSAEPTDLTTVVGASSVVAPALGASETASTTPTSSLVFPTQTASSGSDPYIIGTFFYLGCLGSSSGFQSFKLVSQNAFMTPALCVTSCGDFTYAGVYDSQCYCADTLDSETGISGETCDVPCPGLATQTCGGLSNTTASTPNNGTVARLAKRQAPDLSNVLLTTYENLLDLTGPIISSLVGAIIPPSTSAALSAAPSTLSFDPSVPRVTLTLGAGPSFSALVSSVLGGIVPAATGGGAYYAPPSGSTPVPALTTVVPASSVIGVGMGGGSGGITTVVTTTYVDVCPTGLTTITTTSTITQCSCLAHLGLATAAPTIPMTTTVKVCSVCGPAGGPSQITVTVPATIQVYVAANPTEAPLFTNSSASSPTPFQNITTATIPATIVQVSSVTVVPVSTMAAVAAVQASAAVDANLNAAVNAAVNAQDATKPVVVYSSVTVIPLATMPAALYKELKSANVTTTATVTSNTTSTFLSVPTGPVAFTGAAGKLETVEIGFVIGFAFILVGGFVYV
ncbi:endo-1,3(4)-beta-glucanase [Phlyctema vagabunda]|uniref:Endo-1,3(4)-beta-glucanase n=1 Tax=Phlyctema vagabunda TaxID=108571 RepID=A0ABR4PVW4_9HELO